MLILFFVFAAYLPPGAAAAGPSLGAVPGWECGELRIVQFDSVSGNQGFWQERGYRTPKGTSFKATLMGGKGPKYYNQPADGIKSNDGPYGAGSTYETVTVGGYRAVLETHPILGVSLAVNAFAAGYVLTLEGGNWIDAADITGAAEILIPIVEGGESLNN
jgi:hypothetical protein